MHRHTLVRKGDQGSGTGKLSFGCSAASSSSVWGLEAPWRPSLQPSSRRAPSEGGSGGATLLCRSSGPCEALGGEERTELLTIPDWSRGETHIKSVSCLLLTELKQWLTGATRKKTPRYLPQAAGLYVLDNLIKSWKRLWVSFAIVRFSGGRQRRRRRGELRRVVFLVWELSPRILRGGEKRETGVFVKARQLLSPVTDLQRRVALDVLGTFDDGEVGEPKLICGLNQAHTTPPHLQQHFTDPHWRRVFAAGHLHTSAATVRNFNLLIQTVKRFRRVVNEPAKGRCPRDRRCPSGRYQRCSAPPRVPGRNWDNPTLAPWTGS